MGGSAVIPAPGNYFPLYAAAAAFSSAAAMPFTLDGFLTKSWKMPHSPCPVVPPNALGCWSDMSNTTVFAFEIGTAVVRVIGSGYTLGLSLLFPVAKPPSLAHADAAAGVVRNISNAR